ncbi:hypothetical protein EJ110_NYTH37490 [Nymphaea thermarum]|nr:hypothetical protein EJ110_NYTH37490 [Nymphaea thermarum]
MQTPTGTPRQLTYKAKKELESFPHQSVAQSTNVQYKTTRQEEERKEREKEKTTRILTNTSIVSRRK